jgi:hypothetical protein
MEKGEGRRERGEGREGREKGERRERAGEKGIVPGGAFVPLPSEQGGRAALGL